MDLVHVADAARFLAVPVDDDRAIGATLNIADPNARSWVELLEVVACSLDLPAPRRHLPHPVALGVATLTEAASVVTRREPRLIRYAVSVVGRPYRYATTRAMELGFSPSISTEEGDGACVRAPGAAS